MSTEEKRPNQGGEEDSWEMLAEDLFGIDFGKVAAQNEPPDSGEHSPDESDDSSRVRDDEAAETGTEEAAIPVDSQEASAAVEEDAAPESGGKSPQPEKRDDDSYWNALSDWDWGADESTRGAPAVRQETNSPSRRPTSSAGSSSDKPSERSTSRERRRDEQPAPVNRDAYIDDDDFGLGVLDEAVEQDQAASTTVEGEEPTPPHKRKKRRRRRRRPRGTDQGPETADTESDDLEIPQEAPPAGEVDGAAEPPRSDPDVHEKERPAPKPEPNVPSAYRELPTWEEAVSYLVNPAQTEARSTETSSGTQSQHARSKSDSSKSPNRRSRRRR